MEEEVPLKMEEEEGDLSTTINDNLEAEDFDPYAELLIIDRQYDFKKTFHNYLTLMDSASFSDYQVDFYLNKTQQLYGHEYSAIIGGIPENFPPAFGNSKLDAQNKASALALEALSRRCYTIKYVSRQPEVTLSDIFKDLLVPAPTTPPIVKPPTLRNAVGTVYASTNDILMKETMQFQIDQAGQQKLSLPSKNPGTMASVASGPDTFASKMMKKMGWDGGGLGKDGEGIVEPIKQTLVAGRFGLGHLKRKKVEESAENRGQTKRFVAPATKKINPVRKVQVPMPVPMQVPMPVPMQVPMKKISDMRFIHRARLVIQDFLDNSDNEDLEELVFSPMLTNLQRKLIHNMAGEYNLTSISFGYKSSRHLVLFRSHSVHEFIQKCIRKKEANLYVNFQVIPPDPSKAPLSTMKKENQVVKCSGNGFSAIVPRRPTEVQSGMEPSSGTSFSSVVAKILAEHKSASEKGEHQGKFSCADAGFSDIVSKRLTEFKNVFLGQKGKEDAPTTDFIILNRNYALKVNDAYSRYYVMLMDSAKFSGYEVVFKVANSKDDKKSLHYSVVIKGFREDFPSVTKPAMWTQMMVENEASKIALEVLSQYCYTVKYNDNLKPISSSHLAKNIPPPVKEDSSSLSQLPRSQPLSDPSPLPVSKQLSTSTSLLMNQQSASSEDEEMNNFPRPNILEDCMKLNQAVNAQTLENFKSTDVANINQTLNGQTHENFKSARVAEYIMGLEMEVAESLKGSNNKCSIAEGPETLGTKMMKKMGWDGGALGKDGTGISEPIRASLVTGRFGIGHSVRKKQEEKSKIGQKEKTAPGKQVNVQSHVGTDPSPVQVAEMNAQFIRQVNLQGRFGIGQSLCDLIEGNAPVRKQAIIPGKTGEPVKQQALASRKITAQQPPKLTKKQKRNAKIKYWCRSYIQEFIEKSEQEDLIFCRSITKDPIPIIRNMAAEFKLRCMSFGYKKSAHLVLYRTSSPREFLQKSLEKQNLNCPLNFKIIPPPVQ